MVMELMILKVGLIFQTFYSDDNGKRGVSQLAMKFNEEEQLV